MIDDSALAFEENTKLTRTVVKYAHEHKVTVEGELGVLSGREEDLSHEKSLCTDPDRAAEFGEKTNVDSLAVSIGNAHGITKFKIKPGEPRTQLRFDILEEIEKRLPNYPIVLHGTSSLSAEYVNLINRYGGNIQDVAGIPENQVKEAVKRSICKVNIASDGWQG